jgi:hypothetical protein
LSQILGIFNACADGPGELTEEVGERGGELVATDEPTVVTKPLLDAIVVEDGQGDGSFPNPASADESDGSELFRETDDLFDPFVASKEDPRWGWWGFSGYAGCKYQIPDPLVAETADLVRV